MARTMRQTYGEALNRISGLDLGPLAAVLGAKQDGPALLIAFYDRTYRVADTQIADLDGNPPTDAVGAAICQYLLQCPDRRPDAGPLVTFRELAGAGPLVSSFVVNTNKIIAGTFARRLSTLEAHARKLGGATAEDETNFDLYMRFQALPRVPVILQFNAADDLFPAQCALLFHQSAQHYLDPQSLFILGTYLAGRLIQAVDE